MGGLVLIVFGVISLWEYYNYRVFGKRTRRKGLLFDAVGQLAKHYNVTPEKVVELQSKKEVNWPASKE